MKASVWLGVCCVVMAYVVGAADLVSVSSAGGTVNYATIESALNACSGGETLTLLGDVTVATDLPIAKRVTIDLGGHTLANSKGQFLKPQAGCDGLVVRNGTVTSADCCFAFQEASARYTVSVSNVTFNGICMLYGATGTLSFQADCVCRCGYLCSSGSWGGCTLNVYGGVVAQAWGVYDNPSWQGTKLNVFGGSFTTNPSEWVDKGSMVTRVDHVEHGVVCAYRVAVKVYVAEVEPAGGGTATRFTGLVDALNACTSGCTLRLLRNCTLGNTFNVNTAFTLDLNGFSLESVGRAFGLNAGATDFRIVNGTCRSSTEFMYANSSSVGVTVSNCTLAADMAVSGPKGTDVGRARFADSRFALNYLTSGSTRMGIQLENCLVSLARRTNDGHTDTSATIRTRAGRFTHNMTPCLADGYSQIVDETTVDGVAYRFRVLPTTEAGTLYAAETISSDGATTNRYTALVDAVNVCASGGTVRMLQDCTQPSTLAVPRNMTLDLCGLKLANTSGNFIQPAAGVTLCVKDGDLSTQLSLFDVNASAAVTVNVTNCSIMGYCPVWGRGTVNTYSCWFRNLSQLKSSNGSATMNVYDGMFASLPKWSDGAVAAGTTVRVYSARFVNNPMGTAMKDYLLAPGSAIYFEPFSYHNEYYPHRVVDAVTASSMPVEATFAGIGYTNVVQALENASREGLGGTVTLQRTLTRSLNTPDIEGSCILDFGGYEQSISADAFKAYGGPLTLRNGVIRLMGSGKSAFVLQYNAKLTATDSFALLQNDYSWNACGVYVPGNNARLVFDGATISTARLVSWGDGMNTIIEVCGDGSNTCKDVYWPGTSPKTGSRLIVRGGWWKADPTAWVTNNHVVLHQVAATPCGWRVRDFSKLTGKGWDFSFDDPFLGATATGTVAVTEPVTVKLSGTIPTRRTLLADLSSVTVTGGTLAFKKDASLPNGVCVEYENGRLYAWEPKGLIVLIK